LYERWLKMRDVEQMREKYQLQLDGRQIAALALGALLLLSCVFALGLGLGRRLSREAPQPADLDSLDAAQSAPAAPLPKPAPPPVQQAAPVDAPPPPAAQAEARDAVVVAPPKKETLVVAPPPRSLQASAVVLTPPPKDLAAYTVQIGASPDRAEASRLESKARGAGLKPYVVEADLGAKGTWYRVRVGSFEDKDSANQFRKDVERELRAAAVVMPTK
jgi:DedD protein